MDRRISPPFVRQAVEQGREKLRAAGIDSPKLCAEVLLASVLDVERTWLVSQSRAWQALGVGSPPELAEDELAIRLGHADD